MILTRGEEELINVITGALHPSMPASAVLKVVDAVKGMEIMVTAGYVRKLEGNEWLDWEDGSDYFHTQVEDLPGNQEGLD
jgi:hypothetical protein